jgi:hypothetical protein
MKIIICFLILTTWSFAQDATIYLKNFDNRVYSLKTKGIKDFVVDIESSRLTKQVNVQQTFGKVEELIFRVYWTQDPERIAIEVIGLPDGFKEIKDELKFGILQLMDNLIPQTFVQRFAGYKFSSNSPKVYLVRDATGVAAIPSFVLKFDEQDKLIEIIGNKPVGELEITPVFEKTAFSDGKWVLVKQTTKTNENGQFLTVTKELEYSKVQGIGTLSQVNFTTEHRPGSEGKPVTQKDELKFKNYRINEGIALKYFLGDAKTQPGDSKSPGKSE